MQVASVRRYGPQGETPDANTHGLTGDFTGKVVRSRQTGSAQPATRRRG